MAQRRFATFGASLGAVLSKQGFAPQETAAARVSRGSSPSLPLNRHTRRQPHPKSPCATLRTDDPAFRLVFVCVVEVSIDTVNLCAVLAKLAPPSPLAFPLRDRPQRLGPVASCVLRRGERSRSAVSFGSRARLLRGAARAKSSSSRRYAREHAPNPSFWPTVKY